MAPLVSPFSPLSSTSPKRGGVPAGKQSRPIVAWPYPRWTNHRRARRAKMNESLSPSLLFSLRSSLSAISDLSSLTWLSSVSRLLAWRIPGVLRPTIRRSVRLPLTQQCSQIAALTPLRVPLAHAFGGLCYHPRDWVLQTRTYIWCVWVFIRIIRYNY